MSSYTMAGNGENDKATLNSDAAGGSAKAPDGGVGKDEGGGGGGSGGGGGRDSILSRKLKKIVECDLEADVELQEALKELSTFFPENTLRTRRFLRGDIERRSLQVSQHVN